MSSTAPSAPDAERADAAVRGQLVAEDELLRDLRAQRIEAADGRVVRRLRRDDRAAHPPVLDDATEVARPCPRRRDVVAVRPERQRALDQDERVDRPRQVGLGPPGPATVAEATMQPKLWPIRWKRTRGAGRSAGGQQLVRRRSRRTRARGPSSSRTRAGAAARGSRPLTVSPSRAAGSRPRAVPPLLAAMIASGSNGSRSAPGGAALPPRRGRTREQRRVGVAHRRRQASAAPRLVARRVEDRAPAPRGPPACRRCRAA